MNQGFAGWMSSNDEDIRIGIRGDISGGTAIKNSLDQIGVAADKATDKTQKLEKDFKALSNAGTAFAGVAKGFIAAFGIRELVQIADQMTMIEGRLKNATRSAEEATQAMTGLRQITVATGASMETTVSVFQRLSFVRDEIDATVGQMLQFTDTVSKLGVVSGSSQGAMQAGLTQLGQALSAGIVRAEEFNSIMENIPAVGKQIADQFGVTTGELRKLVIEGVVLSEDVFAAILNSTIEVNAQFDNMPKTVGRAAGEIASAFAVVVAELDKSVGGSNALVSSLEVIANAVTGLGNIFIGAANTAQAAFKAVFGTIYDAFSQLTSFIGTTLNGMLDVANRLPGVDIDFRFKAYDRESFVKGMHDSIGEDISQASKAFSSANRAFAGTSPISQQANQTRAITTDYQKLVSEITKGNKASKETDKLQKDILSAVKGTLTEEERLTAEISGLQRLRGLANTREQIDQINTAIVRTQEELEEVRIQAEVDGPIGKAFQSLFDEVDDGFKDAFKDAFTETDGGWKKLLEGWKNTFKNFLAEMAYQALARPIVLSVVSSVGGAMGLSGGAVSSITGGSGGLGGIGDILSGGKSISSLFSGGSGGGMSSWINGLGSSLGFYNPIPAAGMMGPVAPTGLFGATTLSQAMGGGAIGGALAGMLGLGSGNMIMDTGLGLGGALLGQALIPIPGLGAGIGSFLGTALGGVFGKKTPPRTTIGGSIIPDAEGIFGINTTGTKGGSLDDAASWLNDISAQLNAILGATGGGRINQMLGSLQTNVGTKDPGTFYGVHRLSSAPGDTDAVIRYLLGDSFHTGNPIEGGDSRLTDVVRKSANMGSSSEQIYADLQMAREIYGIAAEDTDNLATALAALDKEFQKMIDRADDLGLPLDKLNEYYDKQKDLITDALKAQEAGFASMEQMIATFEGFLKGQALGANSSLSPMGKLQLAQDSYQDLLGKAQGGDLTVTQSLLAAAAELLNIGRGVYASSQGFADLEAIVRADVKDIAKAAGVPGYASGADYASGGMAWAGENGRELINFPQGSRVHSAGDTAGILAMSGNVAIDNVRTNAQLVALLSELNERMAEVARNQKSMLSQQTKLNSFMTVANR